MTGDGKQQEAREPVTFDWWFDRWHPTEEPEIKRLCRIVWDVSRDAARQASQPSIGPRTVNGYDGAIYELHTVTGQPSHASGEMGRDTVTCISEIERAAFQRGQQAMAEKAAQHEDALRKVNDLQHRMAIELDAIPQQPRIEFYTRQMEEVICRSLAGAEPEPARHLTADDARIALQPLMVKQFAWQEAADALNRRVGAVEPPQDKREVLLRCGCGRQLIWQNEERRCMICPHCVTERLMLAQRMLGKTVVLPDPREPGASERKEANCE